MAMWGTNGSSKLLQGPPGEHKAAIAAPPIPKALHQSCDLRQGRLRFTLTPYMALMYFLRNLCWNHNERYLCCFL